MLIEKLCCRGSTSDFNLVSICYGLAVYHDGFFWEMLGRFDAEGLPVAYAVPGNERCLSSASSPCRTINMARYSRYDRPQRDAHRRGEGRGARLMMLAHCVVDRNGGRVSSLGGPLCCCALRDSWAMHSDLVQIAPRRIRQDGPWQLAILKSP